MNYGAVNIKLQKKVDGIHCYQSLDRLTEEPFVAARNKSTTLGDRTPNIHFLEPLLFLSSRVRLEMYPSTDARHVVEH